MIRITNDKDCNNLISQIKNTSIIINIEPNIQLMFDNFLKLIPLKDQNKYYDSKINFKYNIIDNLLQYKFLLRAVKISSKILSSNKINEYSILKQTINPFEWNIFVYDNIMWNFPFTLENVIFMPISYINKCNNDINKLVCTIIHEQIHIAQRSNYNMWNKWITDNDKNWQIVYPDTLFYNKIQQIIPTNQILNPDTQYDFKFIYNIDNNNYWGTFILSNEKINIKWFDLNSNKTLDFIPIEQEHPYEIWAYKMSIQLIIGN